MTVNIEYFMLDPWANTLHSSKPSTSVFPIQLFRFFMGPGSDNFLRFDSNSFAVPLLVKFPRGMIVETLFRTIPPSSCIGPGAWYYRLTWIDLWDIDRLSPNLKVLLCGWTCLCLYSSTLSTFSFCSSSMIECSLRSSTTLEREVELGKEIMLHTGGEAQEGLWRWRPAWGCRSPCRGEGWPGPWTTRWRREACPTGPSLHSSPPHTWST